MGIIDPKIPSYSRAVKGNFVCSNWLHFQAKEEKATGEIKGGDSGEEGMIADACFSITTHRDGSISKPWSRTARDPKPGEASTYYSADKASVASAKLRVESFTPINI